MTNGSRLGDDRVTRALLPVGRSGWAIAALAALLAIIDIKRHPEKHGMGRAVFGLIMGLLGSAFLVIFLLG